MLFVAKQKKYAPIFIDALSFSQETKSGIGHISEEIALALEKEIKSSKVKRAVYLVVPLGKSQYVSRYISDVIKVKTILLPARLLHLLNNLNLLPPLDLFLGKGDYLFPNYRNWKLLFSKSFTYIHDLSYFHYPNYVEPKNLDYLKKNINTWIKRADIIITASQYTKAEIVKYLHVDNNRVRVIPHGIDTEKFFRIKKHVRSQVLKSYGIDKEGYILHVGNIEPRKNIRGLIAAYADLPVAITSNHPLVLVGGGGWLNELEMDAIKKAVSSGLDILRPNRYVADADLPCFYSSAKCLVMPSHYEGFGIPPLQAMACGTPIVVSDNSSLREIFGETGILVDSNSITSIKNGIESSLNMTPLALRDYNEKANQMVKIYSWRAVAEKLLKVMDEMSSVK